MELLIDVADVRVHGGVAHLHLVGDFLVEKTLRQQIQNFRLARRKALRLGGHLRRLLERLDNFPRDVAAHRRAARLDLLDGRQQFRWRRLLEHVARRAGRERVEDVLGVLIHGEHDELRAGQLRLEPPHAFHAVHARQVDVHQNHFGKDLGKLLQRLLRAAVPAHAFESRRAVNQLRQAAPDLRVVLDDGNGNAHLKLAASFSAKPSVPARNFVAFMMRSKFIYPEKPSRPFAPPAPAGGCGARSVPRAFPARPRCECRTGRQRWPAVSPGCPARSRTRAGPR